MQAAPLDRRTRLVAVLAGALAGLGALVVRWSRAPEWSWRHVAALAWGGLPVRTTLGFVGVLLRRRLAQQPAGVPAQ